MNIAYNMDCMDYMSALPDKSIDLTVADPPYFSGPERRGYYGRAESTTAVRRINYHKTDKWAVPEAEVFREIERVSKRYIVFGCNYFQYIFASGRIVWDKCNGDSTFSDCEIAATNCHDSVRLFRYLWNGMMQGKSITQGEIQRGDKRMNEVRIHPTQKPVDLYRWIFTKYAKPGFRVFDPYLGSGSIRIAALELGLDFTGTEIEKCFFDDQEKRFSEYAAQGNLFLRGGTYGT